MKTEMTKEYLLDLVRRMKRRIVYKLVTDDIVNDVFYVSYETIGSHILIKIAEEIEGYGEFAITYETKPSSVEMAEEELVTSTMKMCEEFYKLRKTIVEQKSEQNNEEELSIEEQIKELRNAVDRILENQMLLIDVIKNK